MYLDLLLALNIYDTSISITGLHRFCQSVEPSDRTVGIELPLECIEYLSGTYYYETFDTPELMV